MTTQVRVIVVHGIGQQSVGSTVQRWAEAFQGFAGAESRAVQVVDTLLTEPPATCTLQIWEPGTSTGPLQPPPAEPPSVEMRMIEAHWADAFPQPSAGRVLRWLLTVGPSLAVFQAAAIWRDRTIIGTKVAAARSTISLVPIAGGVAALVLAGPVVAILLTALLIASWLPIPAVKRVVARVLGVLATAIGDSFLFVADPISRSAMVSRLAERLDDCQEGSPHDESVHVVAHSQGAAVTYHALQLMPPGHRPNGLVTVGSGLGRLHDVAFLRPPWWTTPLNVVVLALAVGIFYSSPAWAPLLILGATVGAAVLLRYWYAVAVSLNSRPTPLEGVCWLDLWAPFDLVPNGRAVADDGDLYRKVLVPADLSAVRDHVRYDKDRGESLPRILRHITDVTGGAQLGRDTGVRRKTGPFARRDVYVLVLRVLCMAAGVVAFVAASPAEWGTWIRDECPDWLWTLLQPVVRLLEAALSPLSSQIPELGSIEWIIGAVALLGVGLLGAILTRRAFSFVQDQETLRWLADPRKRWSARTWAWLLGLPTVCTVATCALAAYATTGPP